MAISRYGTQSAGGTVGAGQQDNTVTANESGVSSGTATGTSNSTTNAVNMDPGSLAALQALIAQLAGGGTPQQIKDRAARQTEINNVTQQRAGYSKAAAFADSQGLMAQNMRQVLEKLIPSLSRSAEGAGTSASSLRALMVQDAGNRAAESASALGVQAAGAYGNISNSSSSILEMLTRPNDSTMQALLQALQLAKGAVTSSSTSGSDSKSSNTITSGNKVVNTDYVEAPNIGTAVGSGGGSSYNPYGLNRETLDYVNSSQGFVGGSSNSNAFSDALAQFTGNQSGITF